MNSIKRFFSAVGDAIGLAILLGGLLLATGNFRATYKRALRKPAPAAAKQSAHMSPSPVRVSA